jgi:spore germination cell wall hydrolase CwlJ-like protein
MISLKAAILCVALTLNWEGASSMEPNDSLFAIAFVIQNRAAAQHKSVCKVVYQRKQFSWTNGALDKHNHLLPQYIPKNNMQWRQAKLIAELVVTGAVRDFTGGATHYYAHYISKPVWAKGMVETGRWGTHHFLRDTKMFDKYETGGVPYTQFDTMKKCPDCGAVYVGAHSSCFHHACEQNDSKETGDKQS